MPTVLTTAKPVNFNARMAGLTVSSIVPALFWPSLLWFAGPVLGYHFILSHLITLGVGIALFLASVCAPLMLRR